MADSAPLAERSPAERYYWSLLWYAVCFAALLLGAPGLAVVMTAAAGLGGWQNSIALVRDEADPRPICAAAAAVLPAAAFVDLRLCALFVAAGVSASAAFGWFTRREAESRLSRWDQLILAWLVVGLPAVALVAVARESLAAAVVLLSVALAFDTGLNLLGVEDLNQPNLNQPRPFRRLLRHIFRQLLGYLLGLIAAAAVIFFVTGISLPPYSPADNTRLTVAAAVALPLSQILASLYRLLRRHRRHRPRFAPTTETSTTETEPSTTEIEPPSTLANLTEAFLTTPWSLRRLDSLLLAAVAWVWATRLLGF